MTDEYQEDARPRSKDEENLDVRPITVRAVENSVALGPISAVISDLAAAKPGEVQKIAASQIELLTSYYNAVLAQARKSFTWALVAAGIGLAFFLGSVAFLLFMQSTAVAVPVAAVGVIGGALVEVIAGINFWLYSKTTAQLAAFHQHLDQTQRFLLANSICESLEGEAKQQVRSSLAHVIANPNLKP